MGTLTVRTDYIHFEEFVTLMECGHTTTCQKFRESVHKRVIWKYLEVFVHRPT